MLHTKFHGNRPAGSGEEIFERFLPYMGFVAILVMWPASCHQIFISLYLKALNKKLVQIGTEVSEKIQFEFLYLHTLGQGQEITLTFNTHISSIYSIRCHFFP